jgi:ribonuclease Z
MAGFPSLKNAVNDAGRSAPLTVLGPDGVEDVVRGYNLAYQADDDYRSALHGLPTTEAALTAHPFGLASAAERTTHTADTVLLDDGGLKITAFQVNHEPVYPAVGYRFDYEGRSVAFSGDTIRWPNVVTHAANADVLIHEAQSVDARRILVQAFRRNGQDQLAEVMTDTSRYHTTALDAASVANEAKVRLLVFNHLGSSPPDNLLTRLIFARGLNKIRAQSQWRIGFDGMIIDLPAGERVHSVCTYAEINTLHIGPPAERSPSHHDWARGRTANPLFLSANYAARAAKDRPRGRNSSKSAAMLPNARFGSRKQQ